MKLLIIALLIFSINIPFGTWRESQKKFSLNWFLAIHIPVPFVILFRYLGGITFDWTSFLLFLSMFFTGQLTGKYVYIKYWKNRSS
jgi:hypothetical protein